MSLHYYNIELSKLLTLYELFILMQFKFETIFFMQYLQSTKIDVTLSIEI